MASGMMSTMGHVRNPDSGGVVCHESQGANSMTAKPPPVPPANRSSKGPSNTPKTPKDTSRKKSEPENLDQQDQQANIAQNTTNRGYQQDR
jgi:hypothetical protein